MKNLLTSIHDAIRWLLHVVLIPVIAILKAVIAGLSHIEKELEKVNPASIATTPAPPAPPAPIATDAPKA